MPDSPLVLIAVCTRARPKMLTACLQSLLAQQTPDGCRLAVLVVENDNLPRCQPLVDEAARRAPFPVYYRLEPEQGIPLARNAALQQAVELGADWIAFLDDDETAPPEWIGRLCQKAVHTGAEIVNGPVKYLYPARTPRWFQRRESTGSGSKPGSLATNNVLVRASVFADSGLGLRFNEGMRYTGGSDGEYFRRALERGARAAWCAEAHVVEAVPENRVTLGWQLRRAFRTASNRVEVELQQKGMRWAVLRRVPKNVFRLLGSLFYLPFLLLWPTGLAALQRLGFKGMKNLASALGGLSRYAGFRPQPYRQIDGE